MKVVGRIGLCLGITIAAIAVFRDGILYLAGSEKSRIVHLKRNTLKYVRSEELNFGGPGIHVQPVGLYQSSEGKNVAIYEPAKLGERRLFLRGKHNIYSGDHAETLTTYEPFVLWAYVIKRVAALFIITMLLLAIAGLALKLFPAEQRADGP
jgi:hypothetical protein